MQRTTRTAALVAFLLVVVACADSPELTSAPAPTQPPTSTTSMAAEQATMTPGVAREPGPMVNLGNGESVPLYEGFEPATFSAPTVIDNPWLPMEPGTRMVFEGFTREGSETLNHRLIFIVTDLVKVIDGVPSLIRWDVDYSDGEMVETEIAFYAQDDEGTVWRMGEYPEEWEEGEFIIAPAWLAGSEDARAGIAMPARPRVGSASFSQGWGPEVEFNDRAFIWELGAQTCVAVDCYQDVMIVNEFNDDEPGAHQLKYYAEGIGNIQVGWRGDDTDIEELELVELSRLTTEEMDAARDAALTLDQRASILLEDLFATTEPAVVGVGY